MKKILNFGHQKEKPAKPRRIVTQLDEATGSPKTSSKRRKPTKGGHLSHSRRSRLQAVSLSQISQPLCSPFLPGGSRPYEPPLEQYSNLISIRRGGVTCDPFEQSSTSQRYPLLINLPAPQGWSPKDITTPSAEAVTLSCTRKVAPSYTEARSPPPSNLYRHQKHREEKGLISPYSCDPTAVSQNTSAPDTTLERAEKPVFSTKRGCAAARYLESVDHDQDEATGLFEHQCQNVTAAPQSVQAPGQDFLESRYPDLFGYPDELFLSEDLIRLNHTNYCLQGVFPIRPQLLHSTEISTPTDTDEFPIPLKNPNRIALKDVIVGQASVTLRSARHHSIRVVYEGTTIKPLKIRKSVLGVLADGVPVEKHLLDPFINRLHQQVDRLSRLVISELDFDPSGNCRELFDSPFRQYSDSNHRQQLNSLCPQIDAETGLNQLTVPAIVLNYTKSEHHIVSQHQSQQYLGIALHRPLTQSDFILAGDMHAADRLSRLIVQSPARRHAIEDARKAEAGLRKTFQRDDVAFPPYKFIELIGKGSYGRVYKCHDLQQNRIVAIKIMNVDKEDYEAPVVGKDQTISDVIHEIQILKRLAMSGSTNVNQIFEARSVHTQIWVVTEYCPGGSVRTLMRPKFPLLEERYIKPIAREIASGLRSIHDANMIHRDIKGANIMIHEKGNVQLIDFGVAAVLQTSKERRSTMTGTPNFMAPELLASRPGFFGGKKYGAEVDVWAYGATLIEMATGGPPGTFDGRRVDYIEFMKEPPRLRDERHSEGLREFVAFVMKPDQAERPTMQAVCEHPYIANTEEEHPTSVLVELVDRFKQWEESGQVRSSLINPLGAALPRFSVIAQDYEDWNFSTTSEFDDNAVTAEVIDQALAITADQDAHASDAPEEMSTIYPSHQQEEGQPMFATSDEIQHEAPTTASFDAVKATKGERGLQTHFHTSDLPLRSDEDYSTHHQELQYDAGVIPSTSVAPVNLSSVAQVKANAQNKRKTMDWSFPTKPISSTTATIDTKLPAVPRAQLVHTVTAAVGTLATVSNEIDLDAMWGDEFVDTRASALYAQPPVHTGTYPTFNPVRATLDLDAMMTGEYEPMLVPFEPSSVRDSQRLDLDALMSREEHMTARPYNNTPYGTFDTSSGQFEADTTVFEGQNVQEQQGNDIAFLVPRGVDHIGQGSDFGARTITLISPPPRTLSSHQRGEILPTPLLPQFPADLLVDDIDDDALTEGLRSLLTVHTDYVSAIYHQLGQEQYDEEEYEDDEHGEDGAEVY